MKYIRLHIITVIIALLIVQFVEEFQGMLMGGISTVRGFPIPYYVDLWATPGIEKYEPWLKYFNILILYLLLAIIGSVILYHKKTK